MFESRLSRLLIYEVMGFIVRCREGAEMDAFQLCAAGEANSKQLMCKMSHHDGVDVFEVHVEGLFREGGGGGGEARRLSGPRLEPSLGRRSRTINGIFCEGFYVFIISDK